MGEGHSSQLVAVGTSWNEIVYLKCLLPQLLVVCDKVLIVDDFSTDGTKEWIESLNEPRVEFYQRKFDDCAHQFDFILQKAPKDNTWIWVYTPDELPTDYWFDNIRAILDDLDTRDVDRAWTTVFHLRGETETAAEIGGEIRLFRNDEHHQCRFIDYPHERLDGRFDGHCISQVDERFAFVHFKQVDKEKMQLWKTDYIEKGVYSLADVKRRLDYATISLPVFIRYRVNDELRRFFGWR